ncbi:50S ribosomal protein L6, partial [archaeon]|nr:50S ribosomal protein L6 [archaeon]
IEIPQGINVEIEGLEYSFSGPKGKVTKKFNNPSVQIQKQDNMIKIFAKSASKKEKAVLKAYKAHILNAFKGCNEPFLYKLKICSGHFPMSVAVNNNRLVIKNFLGEKVPREVQLNSDAKVKIDGANIYVESSDKEKAGQAAATIEQATRRPGFDKRIFQDGIYITDKAGKEI